MPWTKLECPIYPKLSQWPRNFGFSGLRQHKAGSLWHVRLLPGLCSPGKRELTPSPAQVTCANWYNETEQLSSLQGLHFFRAPLLKEPPLTALPIPNEAPSWYGEFWLQYPSVKDKLFPMHYGHVFRAIAMLRLIANDIACAIFENDSVKRSLTPDEITMFSSRLKAWFRDLPDSITPTKVALPCQLKIQ